MLYNEELEEYCAKLRANAQEFLNNCGKKKMEIYRIENFKPIEIEEEYFGEFYDGDSYVCVCNGEKNFDIHYWEGKDSTADETGSAAAFTVQLSDNLKKPSRHHLELQGEETDLFMSRFPKGIKILHGGVASGFKHYVPPEHQPSLMRVVGDRYPRIFPIEMDCAQMNHGDCFILDLGTDIYLWYGKDSNTYERLAAVNYANDLKNRMRKMKCKAHFPEEGHNDQIE